MNQRTEELQRSVGDNILQPSFKILVNILSHFISRVALALSLLPIYILVKFLTILPTTIRNARFLLSEGGRDRLICLSDLYRASETKQAEDQLSGAFRFEKHELLQDGQARGWLGAVKWSPHVELFEMEGARVNFVHEQPGKGQRHSGKKIILLHGNPSWSFMWRNVIPDLVESGHEVFALHWLGHGASDKPVSPASINFELHMRTLMHFIEQFNLRGCYIVAHDWGGCIALCTLSLLPAKTCSGLFLLNTFFPPRPSDISIYYYLLYIIWFLSTGIFDGYLPDSVVMRFMAPSITQKIASGYSAPFSTGPIAKASVGRFAHIVPGLPDFVLYLRNYWLWLLLEGLVGSERFTNINAQARLAERNVAVRRWWGASSSGCGDEDGGKRQLPKVAIVFGEDDPLLREFRDVLSSGISRHVQDGDVSGIWVSSAGHYPVEERPEEIAGLVQRFIDIDD